MEFPHLEGDTGIRIAELDRRGNLVPYPDARWNAWKAGSDPQLSFVRVNATRIGPDGNLWVVDTGTPQMGGKIIPGGVKLVCVDTTANKVKHVYALDAATSATSFVDDVRFHGAYAYLTDAGVPGLIVLNLNSGNARWVLDHDISTTDTRSLIASGKVLRMQDGGEVRINTDQLEVSPDGNLLYYQPLSGPMYRIETRYLDDPSIPATVVAQHRTLWVNTPTTGGTVIDAAGNLYLSDVSNRQILKITPTGRITTLVKDDRLDWVDAMWIDRDGFLWMPAAQLDQLSLFDGGISGVRLPMTVFKLHIGVTPEY